MRRHSWPRLCLHPSIGLLAFRRHLRACFGAQRRRHAFVGHTAGLVYRSLVLAERLRRFDGNVASHSARFCDGPRKNRRQPFPKSRKEILSAFYDLRLVLFGRRPIALVALGFVMYGALITIRGLWIVPMFVERYALTLVAAGNVALLVSVAIILGLRL